MIMGHAACASFNAFPTMIVQGAGCMERPCSSDLPLILGSQKLKRMETRSPLSSSICVAGCEQGGKMRKEPVSDKISKYSRLQSRECGTMNHLTLKGREILLLKVMQMQHQWPHSSLSCLFCATGANGPNMRLSASGEGQP